MQQRNLTRYWGPMPMRVLIVDDHPIVASGAVHYSPENPRSSSWKRPTPESGERAFVAEHP